MSPDERCQVKCCERHLMCFISVCLNCPGTLESLSVNQIRRNETRLLSSEDTCLSAVTQANGRKKGLFFEPFEADGLYDIAPLCIRNCSCGIISLRVSQREDRGHCVELIQTSGVQEHKLFNEAAIWIETPNCFSISFDFQRLKIIIFLHFFFPFLCLPSLRCFEQ